MGLVTPLGSGVKHCWDNLLESRSGVSKISTFDVSDLPAKIAARVPIGTETGDFNSVEYVSSKDTRRMDQFIVFALGAAIQAVEDSGWKPDTEEAQDRSGVMIGSGIGGLQTIENGAIMVEKEGPRRLSPFFIPSSLINLASGHVSIRYGFKGPNHSVVTACSTGAHAIGDAARLIMLNDADVMVAGGAEAGISRLGIAGFSAARALSTNFNDTPEQASRPWDKARDGFVMGEGSGIVVLEEYEHAKKRGATIYAEVVGGGLTADAHHITAPHPDGLGARNVMRLAIEDADVKLSKIDYINVHGTSTPLGDIAETKAIKSLFGKHAYNLNISSTKSMTGHLLGAAGVIEAIACVMAVKENIVPPTINHKTYDPEIDNKLNLTLNKAEKRTVNYALSNTFGFGGHNASVIFKKI